MGAAGSVNKKYDEHEPTQSRQQELYIPLSSLSEKIKIYQSGETGELIVLIGHNVQEIDDVIPNPGDWHLQTVASNLQKSYLESSHIFVTISSSRQPNILQGNRVLSHSNDIPTPKSTLDVKHIEGGGKSFLGQSQSTSHFFPGDFMESGCQIPYFPLLPMPDLDISRSGDGSEAKSISFSDIASFDGPNPEVQPSLSPKGSRSTSRSCGVCGEIFDRTVLTEVEVEEHVATCAETIALKQRFSTIDKRLRPAMLSLSQANHWKMQDALVQAMTRFEKRSLMNNAVLRLTRRVLTIASNANDNKGLGKLRDDLQKMMEALHRDLRHCDERDGDADLRPEIVRLIKVVGDTVETLEEKRELLKQCHRFRLTLTDFNFVRAIGQGSFATVYLAKRKQNGQLCCIKVMEKSLIKSKGMQSQVKKERFSMTAACKHNCDMYVRVYCSFHTKRHLFLVTEFLQGGDCMSLLSVVKRLPEWAARFYVAEVCLAVKTLHEHGVMHRDIKPDNILLTSSGHVKLTDFGLVAPSLKTKQLLVGPPSLSQDDLSTNSDHSRGSIEEKSEVKSWYLPSPISSAAYSKGGSPLEESGSVNWSSSESSSFFLSEQGLLNTQVGNYNYACPELVCRLGYDHTVDWWAVGVLFFHFLAGQPPFLAATEEDTVEKIAAHALNWAALPPEVSPGCRAFIDALLDRERKSRLGFASSAHVIQHSYFADIDFATLYSKPAPLILKLTGPEDTSYFESIHAEHGLTAQGAGAGGGGGDEDSDTEGEYSCYSFTLGDA